MDEELKEALKEDTKFKQYRNIIKHIEKSYDFEELKSEARRLHEGRKSRTLSRVPNADALYEATLQDASNRARLSRIMAQCVEQEGVVDDALDAIRAHLSITYSDSIPALKTKGERVAYLNKYLRSGVKMKSQLKTLMKVLEIYMKDIDQMGFALTNSREILKMIYDSKGKQA